MARDRRASCRSRRDSGRVADGSANLPRHPFAPSQEELQVADATARARLSGFQLARRRLATGFAGRQSRSLADRDHASKQRRDPRRGRLYEPLRQRSSKHFLPHRLRSQNPEIRRTLTDPCHRALSGRQKPRNPAVLRFLLNRPAVRQNTSWLLLPDARGDSTPTTFSHLDRSSRLHHSTAETPITPSVRKHHAGLQSFRSMRRIEARRKNANATRLRFSQSLASLRQRLSHASVRSITQRLGSTTNPLA